ncbi:ClpP/crotonase-like domain-containing protein [Fusarium oxysporum Fo47]|uniref:ClpP/crotonase-like domain-containing protein n=1 Tax=Fusarium oxysporum Fo47 TaxID=660027 RepID=UPI002869960B|nr:ClpP/crotonase-like domain-containing protein [Fusarium oxysporum Fo47]QKD57341.2 ClpP/crotonase-like domain-containing protein [Fusarium oxysporum Fo47]
MFPLRPLSLAIAISMASSALSLDLPQYTGLKSAQNDSILTVTLHNPSSPVNLWNEDTQNDLTDLVSRLQYDNETKVVIFNSDVPRLSQVTIGVVEGRARGAGNEFLVALDMRFATKLDTAFGQPEVGSGLFPGGGGSQFLTNLIGRGRAMEYILSSNDIDAVDAAEIGWINKAFDTSRELYDYVDKLAQRLALFPLSALAGAKRTVHRASPSLEHVIADARDFFKQQQDPLSALLRCLGTRLLWIWSSISPMSSLFCMPKVEGHSGRSNWSYRCALHYLYFVSTQLEFIA